MKTLRLNSRGEDVKHLQHHLHLPEDGIFGPLTLEAVQHFQRTNSLTPDGIVGPLTWAALDCLRNVSRRITEIIIHCSATPEGKDYTAADIRRWHLARGFADIGYHRVIYRDGTVVTGRPIRQIGAHCTGHNSQSIGICYIGGLKADGATPADTRTPAQRAALRNLVATLKAEYPAATIHGHREFANKACPCFDIQDL